MIDLDELERLLATAPGPWESGHGRSMRYPTSVWGPDGEVVTYHVHGGKAALIAALRNAFPALARELRMRRAQVQLAQVALCDWPCTSTEPDPRAMGEFICNPEHCTCDHALNILAEMNSEGDVADQFGGLTEKVEEESRVIPLAGDARIVRHSCSQIEPMPGSCNCEEEWE